VIVGCNCLKKQTTDEKKLAKYTRTPARHVPLSNDNLLREAFSTNTPLNTLNVIRLTGEM
jgi:hypothetical protein